MNPLMGIDPIPMVHQASMLFYLFGKRVVLTLHVVAICLMKATTSPSLTSCIQNGPRKYGFMANVMSEARKA